MGAIRARTACQKCRSLKHRCDFRYPRCSRCEKSKIECMVHHPVTKLLMSRTDYEKLLSSTSDTDEITPLNDSNSVLPKESSELRGGSLVATVQRRKLAEAELFEKLPQLSVLSLVPFHFSNPDEPTSTLASLSVVNLPLKEELLLVIEYFFKDSMSHLHLVDREWVLDVTNKVYKKLNQFQGLSSENAILYLLNCKVSALELYVLYTILTLVVSQKLSQLENSETILSSDEYHKSAQYFLRHILLQLTKDSKPPIIQQTETLRCLLLMSLCGFYKSMETDIYSILNVCGRIVIEMSLYLESSLLSLEQKLPINTESPDLFQHEETIRFRKLFWAWYCQERLVNGLSSRPYMVNDFDITALLGPLESNESYYPLCSLVKLRKIQSQIWQTLYRPYIVNPFLKSTSRAWISSRHNQINDWFSTVYTNKEMGIKKNDVLFMYYSTLNQLYRPCIQHTKLSTGDFIILHNSTLNLLRLYDQNLTSNYRFPSSFRFGGFYDTAILYFYSVCSDTLPLTSSELLLELDTMMDLFHNDNHRPVAFGLQMTQMIVIFRLIYKHTKILLDRRVKPAKNPPPRRLSPSKSVTPPLTGSTNREENDDAKSIGTRISLIDVLAPEEPESKALTSRFLPKLPQYDDPMNRTYDSEYARHLIPVKTKSSRSEKRIDNSDELLELYIVGLIKDLKELPTNPLSEMVLSALTDNTTEDNPKERFTSFWWKLLNEVFQPSQLFTGKYPYN
ncbi:hypothetical protein PP7435_CHR2-0983 [Komagataella phaffii CBS 7435]|uniref:Zn(2)-C6 fungal-type domain-containing protein n=2 Tax=Komagataella phaffii TaxID=460519 RepID=C4R0B0_KOMPG|nr:Hypothetical protein PAS_chr2-1_0319 [Komagataella phaffii GS115]AOA62949.1 GQ67_00356T0 [Komagataella phaffii]CAH2448560.1 hypothetical protein BQ9382_C2-5290 [Komagataella phaffii CBS 7435]AOA67569.1 GQ68_01033T0 [Komagataella phaffii GS115]CAY68934.1 Hypothetical protein PAS_chr2-1_0319 [Komagataella phaffii GS115]CCA38664.1 hypothetical protein PP7435_CHR2-0983 [Komagataella phaffii CBS 7435]